MSHRRLRPAWLAGGLILPVGALIMLLSGCGSAGQPAAGLPGLAGASTPPGGSPTPGPLGTTPSAPDCTTAQLALSQLAGSGGGPAATVIAIQLRNTSNLVCSLYGYPSVTLTIHSVSMSTDLPAAVTVAHGGTAAIAFLAPPTKITIAPGGNAGFLVAYDSQPTGGALGCDHANQMALSLANSPASAVGPVDIALCAPTLAVSPFVLGSLLSLT